MQKAGRSRDGDRPAFLLFLASHGSRPFAGAPVLSARRWRDQMTVSATPPSTRSAAPVVADACGEQT